MSELFEELSLISVFPWLLFPAIILSTVLLLLAGCPCCTVGPEVTRRWARGELGGRGRRTTDTTLWVCSQIRRNRRMLPANMVVLVCS